MLFVTGNISPTIVLNRTIASSRFTPEKEMSFFIFDEIRMSNFSNLV